MNFWLQLKEELSGGCGWLVLQEAQRFLIEFFDLFVDRSVRGAIKNQQLGVANAVFQRFGEASGRDLIGVAESDLRGDGDTTDL